MSLWPILRGKSIHYVVNQLQHQKLIKALTKIYSDSESDVSIEFVILAEPELTLSGLCPQ